MTTVEMPTPATESLGSRLEFETLLSDLSSRFINLPPADVDRAIEDALSRFCASLGFDFAALWQWSADASEIRPTHTFPAGLASRSLAPGFQAQYPWVVQQMRANRAVAIASLDEIPPEAALDRESARLAGIKSNLTLPLTVGGEPPVGALAFNTMRAERDWPPDLVHRLQLVAQVFTNALVRRRHEVLRQEREARLTSGAELAGLGYYEVDFGRGVAYVDDRFHELCGLPAGLSGLQPVQFWIDHLHPDDGPRVMEERRQLHEGATDRLALEYRFLHPTHGQRWIDHLAGVAARDSTGRAIRTYGVLRDITTRRQAEEALRQSLAEVERLKDRLQAESDYLKTEIGLAYAHGEVIGQSAAIKQVLRQVEQVAPTDSSVLIQGETGTGKELVAQAIHRLSSRHHNVMVKVNCAALPAALVESELFGREKGAFTGALTRQVGRFEIADGSTIFLDEIGELSPELQAKLLRVLEAGEFERLGSPRTIRVNVRVIAATNRDLTEEIRQGRFREDLYYRLSVFPIRVPPLRERVEDIPLLAWAFLEEACTRMGKKITRIPRTTMDGLQRRPWPGNVRELKNVIEHGAIVTTGDTLRVPAIADADPGSVPPLTLADAEREHIMRTLERTEGRIKGPSGAAAELGLKPSTLHSRMKKLGIHPRVANGRDIAR
jgi:transcriptional regulator with GAF, ATPase, and Fis domain